MNKYKTEQEAFWAGEFGDEYVIRNIGEKYIADNLNFFSNILSKTHGVKSVIEFGANIGLNIRPLQSLLPDAQLAAIEINPKAVDELKKIEGLSVYSQSILEFSPDRVWDLVFTKGVLIHINPESLNQVYDLMYQASGKYICVAEYYNPSPAEVSYRGYTERLFKRDFAGELLDKFPDLTLVAYGFAYHRDQNFPQDDLTWFLLQKS